MLGHLMTSCLTPEKLKFDFSKTKKAFEMKWVRLNCHPSSITIHHDTPPPTTIQNISTTTHHQPKYVHHHPPPAKICPPRPTTTHQYLPKTHYQPKYIHHHPPLAKIYPPLPTSSQKMDHHHAKAKIYSYITSFRHCVNSFFFFEMHYSFP